MTLTEEQNSTIYLATMESEYTAFEESLFLNLAATRDSTVTAANYTQDVTTQEDKSARLNGNIASRRVGPAKLIAVSPGDSIDMEVFAYFQSGYTNTGDVGQSNLVTAVSAAFGGSASAAIGSEARSVYELFNTNAALAFVGSSGNSTLPKAYLNYILFDQDFNDIAHDYIQVGDTTNTHQQLNLSQSINQGGYIYVWLSNESQTDFNVYFDDLRVTHTKGAILQEDHYYPFGLSINALSNSAPLSKPNKYKFNGNEEQTEFDLNLYDFNARFYDPTLGRFAQVDPLTDHSSQFGLTPYQFAWNNPMLLNDPTGECPKCYEIARGLWDGFIGHKKGVPTGSQDYALDTFRQKDPNAEAEKGSKAYENSKVAGRILFEIGDFATGGGEFKLSIKAGKKFLKELTEEGGEKLAKNADNVARLGPGKANVDDIMKWEVKSSNEEALLIGKIKKAFEKGEKVDAIDVVVHKGQTLLVDGHHRLAAARELGYKTISVNYLTPQQAIMQGKTMKRWSNLDALSAIANRVNKMADIPSKAN